jgi:hypothetical protein
MHIYGRELLYMCIFTFVNGHIRKRASVYVHFVFCICTFIEAKMCIYGRELLYIYMLGSIYAHFGFRQCAYMGHSPSAHVVWVYLTMEQMKSTKGKRAIG